MGQKCSAEKIKKFRGQNGIVNSKQKSEKNREKVLKSHDFRTFHAEPNFCFGGDKRDRTADLLNAIQALSQLSYTPE